MTIAEVVLFALVGASAIFLTWYLSWQAVKFVARHGIGAGRAEFSAAADDYRATVKRALDDMAAELDAAREETARAEHHRARVQRAMSAVCKVLQPRHGEGPVMAAMRLQDIAAAEAETARDARALERERQRARQPGVRGCKNCGGDGKVRCDDAECYQCGMDCYCDHATPCWCVGERVDA